jgi:replicative DNA helicase Mcm
MAIEQEKILDRATEFIVTNYMKDLAKIAMDEEKFALLVDYITLDKFDSELADELIKNPFETLNIFNSAIENIDLPIEAGEKINVRFTNLPEHCVIPIRNIRSKHIGSFKVIEGLVRMASDVRPTMTHATFECPSCGTLIEVIQTEKTIKQPIRCSCDRRGRFRLASKKFQDTQKIVIEENPELLEGGEQPKRINVFLTDDLVDPKIEKTITPGSRVMLTGVVKEMPVTAGGAQLTRFDIMVDCNYIESREREFEDIEVSVEDEKQIRELAMNKNIYQKLLNSIAPTIYGYSKIKEAVVLQLFGGIRKYRPDGTKTRGDIHVLLVGDPGTAKSIMLTHVASVAPKARYVSGKGVSSAGLTATVTRDEFSGGWILEAGAFPLTNKGVLMIDEIDKMEKQDRVAIHEALEQQTISIAKANIQATLRAETTVLAAANPKLGRFNPYETLSTQIDLPPTLINRFDLIFTVQDMPSRETDERLATHVLEIHTDPTKVKPELDRELLRKYISYSKRFCFPKLTDTAKKEIVKFYVNLRNKEIRSEEEVKPIPISPRQLEALIRLSEASARVRLADKITKEDALRAIGLLNYSLGQVAVDETGEIDIDRIAGTPAVKRSKIYKIRDIIKKLSKEHEEGEVPAEEILENAESAGLEVEEVKELLDKMKKEGEIYEPKHKYIKVSPY